MLEFEAEGFLEVEDSQIEELFRSVAAITFDGPGGEGDQPTPYLGREA